MTVSSYGMRPYAQGMPCQIPLQPALSELNDWDIRKISFASVISFLRDAVLSRQSKKGNDVFSHRSKYLTYVIQL